MPVVSHMDTEILGVMRLVGMYIPEKHICRGSDDLLYGPLYKQSMRFASCNLSVWVLRWNLDSCWSILSKVVSTKLALIHINYPERTLSSESIYVLSLKRATSTGLVELYQAFITINNVTSISDWENLNLAEWRTVADTSVSNVHSAAVERGESSQELKEILEFFRASCQVPLLHCGGYTSHECSTLFSKRPN